MVCHEWDDEGAILILPTSLSLYSDSVFTNGSQQLVCHYGKSHCPNSKSFYTNILLSACDLV